jgi:cation diffusion facilitator family transporter
MEPPYPNDFPHSITQHPHPGYRRESVRSSSRSVSRGGGGAATPSDVVTPTPAGSDLPPPLPTPNLPSSTAVDADGAVMMATFKDGSGPVTHRNAHSASDVEQQQHAAAPSFRDSSATANPNDPYGLSLAYKTEQELAGLVRPNMSRKRLAVDPLAHRARRLQGFYRSQNAAIERMLKSVDQHRAEAREEQGQDQMRFKIAVWGSLAANIVLSGLQLFAAISSGSLSLYATMIDSVFDPLSNIMLIVSGRAIRSVNATRFPAGKSRLETCANISFCFLMINVSWIIIAFSLQELASKSDDKEFYLPSVISVCCAFVTKLALFLYCFALRNRYSQVRILWQDHRNDLFVNSFGILTSVGGSKLAWWIDPAGATLLSLLVTFLWLRTAWAEFSLLVGVVAPPEATQLITYTCLTHSPAIKGIDTVRVYHSGPRLLAEVDIVMDPASSLVESHDVAESLQMKLESLPDIERCFVHVDYETSHSPEHSLKKDL